MVGSIWAGDTYSQEIEPTLYHNLIYRSPLVVFFFLIKFVLFFTHPGLVGLSKEWAVLVSDVQLCMV